MSCSVSRTLGLEAGELLAQGVVVVLQLTLLQLHILHVLRQRADLRLMLEMNGEENFFLGCQFDKATPPTTLI